MYPVPPVINTFAISITFTKTLHTTDFARQAPPQFSANFQHSGIR